MERCVACNGVIEHAESGYRDHHCKDRKKKRIDDAEDEEPSFEERLEYGFYLLDR